MIAALFIALALVRRAILIRRQGVLCASHAIVLWRRFVAEWPQFFAHRKDFAASLKSPLLVVGFLLSLLDSAGANLGRVEELGTALGNSLDPLVLQ